MDAEISQGVKMSSVNILGKKVGVRVIGRFFKNRQKVVTILEEIGYGFLAKTDFGKYCCVHYDICGKLYTRKLQSKEAAIAEAEKTKYQMS